MIHYRLIDQDDNVQGPIFRSLARARKALTADSDVYAFASRKDATALSPARLLVSSSSPAPRLLSNDALELWIEECAEARAIRPHYLNATQRRRYEARFDSALFGFDGLGRAVDAQQHMSISCRWVRFQSPIFINGKKSNVKGLKKAL